MKNLIVALFIPLIIGISGCKTQTTPNQPNVNKNPSPSDVSGMSFRYRDSSTPPQYHRSYYIEAKANSSHLSVDCYGEILAEKDFSVSDSEWESLVALVPKLQAAGSHEARGATGTQGRTISVSNSKGVIYELYWDSLSDNKIKKAALDLVQGIRNTAKNLDAIVGATRQ